MVELSLVLIHGLAVLPSYHRHKRDRDHNGLSWSHQHRDTMLPLQEDQLGDIFGIDHACSSTESAEPDHNDCSNIVFDDSSILTTLDIPAGHKSNISTSIKLEDISGPFDTSLEQSITAPAFKTPYARCMPRRSVSEPPLWHGTEDFPPIPQHTTEPQIVFHRRGQRLGVGPARPEKKQDRRQKPYSRRQKSLLVSALPQVHPPSSSTNLQHSMLPYNAYQDLETMYSDPAPSTSDFFDWAWDHAALQSVGNTTTSQAPAQSELVVSLSVKALEDIIVKAVRMAIDNRRGG